MANTYTQIYVQIVFTVQGRKNLIPKSKREELHKYITGIVTNRNQKMLAIFAMPDHIHILVGMTPSISVSDLVRDIKSGSSKHISNNNWIHQNFNWQVGFGAFSYSKNQIHNVVNYILSQEEHHKKKSFKEEYLEFLDKFEIEYKEEYLFEWIDLQSKA